MVNSVLYRYFFFDWLYKDTSRGTIFERHAAWQYNKANVHWLFTYLRRWAFLMTLFYGLGWLFEMGMQLDLIAACFYVPSAVSFTIQTVIGVMIAFLKLMP